ncbi:MAG: esterase/lipase [Kangiellaceae bacterium]|jgi:esterase/lipase
MLRLFYWQNAFNSYKTRRLCLLTCLILGFQTIAWAQDSADKMQILFNKAQSFSNIYEQELGPVKPCDEPFTNGVKACFNTLKNDGNAPYILLPRLSANMASPKGVIVLFHGLSDSPYFISSIGEFLRIKGYVVVAPLTPGHGKNDADADMQDSQLKTRWYTHTNSVMEFARDMASIANLPVVVGGFSTGGAFATYYTINNPDNVEALILFSGALQLSGSAESMANIWGMKTLAKWLDGKYETQGANPYKYPSVASYAGLVLMDIIHDIRDIVDARQLRKPIFAAHSMADNVTLFEGVENLTKQVAGEHTIFKIDESYDLCHADVPMSSVQIVNLQFDKSKINESEKCSVPQANPLHTKMLMMLELFLTDKLANSAN